MNSEEALKRIKDDIEINYLITKHNNEKDKYNYLELLKIIEKDLKLLKVLKKYIYSHDSDTLLHYLKYDEVLEDDSSQNKRN